MDAVPEYLRSVGGPLLTNALWEAGKLKAVDVEGRNGDCVLIELLKQYEDDVDVELLPVFENVASPLAGAGQELPPGHINYHQPHGWRRGCSAA